VTYAYDPAGNLLGASMPGAGLSYSYDARSLPVAASRTNGVATSVAYDPLGRVLSLTHAKASTALNTQSYAYDQAGYLSGAANDISQPLITQASAATVDQANELLTNGPTTYTYDANGNRLTETGSSGTLTYQWDPSVAPWERRIRSITSAFLLPSRAIGAVSFAAARGLWRRLPGARPSSASPWRAPRGPIDDKSTTLRNTDDLSIPLCRSAKRVILDAVARHHVVGTARVGAAVKPVGKLDVRNGHVQFDERGRETAGCQ
jgi:YD repeat-containing protein